jgi:hypothetical protein
MPILRLLDMPTRYSPGAGQAHHEIDVGRQKRLLPHRDE